MRNLFVIIIFLTTFIACNKRDVDIGTGEEAMVSFIATVQEPLHDLTKTGSGDYDRIVDLDYISGITLRVENASNPANNKEKTFLFEDQDDGIAEPIDMGLLQTGTNKFTGSSIAANDPVIWSQIHYYRGDGHSLPANPVPTGTELERAGVYSADLLAEKPLYAIYTVEKEQELFAGNNTVNLDFEPANGRINVVFEVGKDLGFRVYGRIYDRDATLLAERGGINSWADTAFPLVFNTSDMVDGTYVEMQIQKRPTSSTGPGSALDWTDVTDVPIKIDTEVGINKTVIIFFNGSDEVTTTVDQITFEDIQEKYDGTTITNK